MLHTVHVVDQASFPCTAMHTIAMPALTNAPQIKLQTAFWNIVVHSGHVEMHVPFGLKTAIKHARNTHSRAKDSRYADTTHRRVDGE